MEINMNWDVIKGSWKQLKGNPRAPWGDAADDPVDIIADENHALSSEIQQAYGISKEEAETQVSPF
jgi:uncharacterized protein YjbJ (UPF0337 family)